MGACNSNGLDVCRMAVAICFAESKLGTDYVTVDHEVNYYNCAGLKSKEILTTHQADSRGSWLKQFLTWHDFFNHITSRLQIGYFDKKCKTAECIGKYWVGGGASSRWINAVNKTLQQI